MDWTGFVKHGFVIIPLFVNNYNLPYILHSFHFRENRVDNWTCFTNPVQSYFINPCFTNPFQSMFYKSSPCFTNAIHVLQYAIATTWYTFNFLVDRDYCILRNEMKRINLYWNWHTSLTTVRFLRAIFTVFQEVVSQNTDFRICVFYTSAVLFLV